MVEYERAAERYLRSVTNEVLSSKVNWINAAEGDIRLYLNRLGGGWRRMTYLAKWYDEEPERVAAALRDLWSLRDESPDGLPSRDEVFTRIRRFTRELPFVTNLMGAGGRMGLIAALLMRISAEHYPPFGVRMFATAYEFTDYPSRPRMRTRRLCMSMRWSFSTSLSKKLGRVDSNGRATSSKRNR